MTTPASAVLAAAHPVLAAAANPVNTAQIQAILGSVLGVAVLAVAIKAIFHAFKANVAAVLTIGAIVVIGATVWGIDSAGLLGPLGTDFAHAVFKP